MKRACGILMHITSLPSRYGVGTLGKEAYDFVDFLSASGQTYWQMLPVTPTGYADSPYQSSSTYAGNPYLIDLDRLIARGLLTEAECDVDWGDDPTRVDYGKLWEHRYEVLRKAFSRFDRSEMQTFAAQNAWWLDTYALFSAVKTHFQGAPWYEWPDADIQNRTPEAIASYTALLRDEIDFQKFMQYAFDTQWNALRGYANKSGILLIGDLPISKAKLAAWVIGVFAAVFALMHFLILKQNGDSMTISGVVAFIAAAVTGAMMSSSMKPVAKSRSAGAYIASGGSLKLRRHGDRYVRTSETGNRVQG